MSDTPSALEMTCSARQPRRSAGAPARPRGRWPVRTASRRNSRRKARPAAAASPSSCSSSATRASSSSSQVAVPAHAASNSSATMRSCTSEFCRRSSGARWKPNTSTARRRLRSRPRARMRRPLAVSERCDDVEVGLELRRVGVRRRVADRMPQRFDADPAPRRSRRGAHTCR